MREPGFYDDIPEPDYHADRESLSVSGAKVLLKAPALFRWQQDHPVHKDVFDFGSAAHAAVLGVGCEIVVHEYNPEKVRSPKSTTIWKEEQAYVRSRGAVLLLPEENKVVWDMADALKSHRLAMRLLSEGRPEVSAYAPDETTGVTRRCRFDWLGANVLTDYKTCASANPKDWAGRYGVINRFEYAMQASWYLDLARDLGHPATAWCWVAQEKEPPYCVSVIEVDDADLDESRERNRRALDVYAECIASGDWPGYLADNTAARVSLQQQTFASEVVV